MRPGVEELRSSPVSSLKTFDKREFFKSPSATSPMRYGILLLRDWRLCRRTLMRSSPLSGLMTFEIHQNPGNEKGGISRPSELKTLEHPPMGVSNLFRDETEEEPSGSSSRSISKNSGEFFSSSWV